ncbi:ATP synthase F1 subunit gamma [Candidatus Nomurabacteria bacterium]|jgi:F-type H+-transporting ATPase subunit gamma|nr:MAG: ATP synthase F1 subunit gamma [Candidatus Nomurabacteria bacterium]
MAVGKEIKRRIKSIRNTKKITKAMELVAASKMKKAVNQTLQSRHYAKYSQEVLARVADSIKNSTHPYLVEKKGKKELAIVITSNRGLCGAYNTQVFRLVMEFIKHHAGESYAFITIGKKGEAALRRLGQNVIATFPDLPDAPRLADVLPIANLAIAEFEKEGYDHVHVLYTDYVSALSQVPKNVQLLPVSKSEIADATLALDGGIKSQGEYIFEPNSESLIIDLIEDLSRMHIYQMLLESIASEQSSRMIAMKNASDAAGEIIDELTLVFNKARQASITQEISEISAGMASVS